MNDEFPRLFIGIGIPQKQIQKISEFQDEMKDSCGEKDIKWVDPSMLHFTLHFLGETEQDKVPPLKGLLDSVASEVSTFKVLIKGIGAFPSLDRPSNIWLGVSEGQEELAEIHSKLAPDLESLGFELDRRPFRAHLTIARVRRKSKSSLKKKLGEALADFEAPELSPFSVTDIRLYRSKLSPKGACYTVLHKALIT